MDNILLLILSLSLSGSIMIAALFLLRLFSKRHINYRWQYYIWLVVIARLVFPVTQQKNLSNTMYESVRMNIGIFNEISEGDQTQSQNSNQAVLRSGDEEQILIDTKSDLKTQGMQETIDLSGSGKPDDPAEYDTATLLGESGKHIYVHNISLYVTILYLVVTALYFSRKIIQYCIFIRNVKRQCVAVEEMNLLEILGGLLKKYRINKHVKLFKNAMVTSPMVLGAFYPIIVIPQTDGMPASDLSYMLEHEVVHIKRRDILYKWVVQITVCIHWFNPLVHLMAKDINRMCELSCDESVIHKLSKEKKIEYGTMLLHAAKAVVVQQSNVYPAASLHTSKHLLKERLGAIMKKEVLRRRQIIIGSTITAVLCVVGIVFGACKISNNNSKNQVLNQDIACDAIVNVASNEEQTVPNTDLLSTDSQDCYDIFSSMEYGTANTYYFSKDGNSEIQASSAYVSYPYIVEVAWNLGTTVKKNDYTKSWLYDTYKIHKKLTLDDKSVINVSYTEECKAMAKDSNFDTALQSIFKQIKKNATFKSFPITYPLVKRVQVLTDKDYSKAAEEFYKNDDAMFFAAVFYELDDKTKEKYMNETYHNTKYFSFMIDSMNKIQIDQFLSRAYKDNKSDIFSMLIDETDESTIITYLTKAYEDERINLFTIALNASNCDNKTIAEYARKAYKDKNISFFTIAMDSLSDEELNKYALTSYKDGSISFFTVLMDYLDNDQINKLLEQSYQDKKIAFFSVLANYADDDEIEAYAAKAKEEKNNPYLQILN